SRVARRTANDRRAAPRLAAGSDGGVMTPSTLSMVRGVGREFHQIADDAFQLTIPSLDVKLTVDRIRRERNELIGELTVLSGIAGGKRINDDGAIHIADWNLSSADARWKRA